MTPQGNPREGQQTQVCVVLHGFLATWAPLGADMAPRPPPRVSGTPREPRFFMIWAYFQRIC